MSKMKVCILFGGRSPEHDISLKSAKSIINNLDKEKYELILVGITKQGEWYLYGGSPDCMEADGWLADKTKLKKAIISPDAGDKAIFVFDDEKMSKINPDIVFPVLHGENGEDGTIQGLLELSGIKYVGMGVLSSAVAMDKAYAKIIFKHVQIPQADWEIVKREELDNMQTVCGRIEERLGYPCFVKPCNTGSSVGVGKAHNREELVSALCEAAKFDRKVIVEEFIDGHEVECAVKGNLYPQAAEVGEIIPAVEFYDFNAKYTDASTELQIPAKILPETRELIREYAIRAFTAIDGRGLTRADFFIRYSDGSVVINEVNTMPGFTNISMYPKLWQAAGTEYPQLLDELIMFGMER